MSNIILKTLSETIFIVDDPKFDPRNGPNNPKLFSGSQYYERTHAPYSGSASSNRNTTAQMAATIVASRSLFSSSVTTYLFHTFAQKKIEREIELQDSGHCFEPLFPPSHNGGGNQLQTEANIRYQHRFSNYLVNQLHRPGVKQRFDYNVHLQFFSLFLLHTCPTVQKFLQVIYFDDIGHRDYSMAANNHVPLWPSSNISNLPFDKMLTRCFGKNLKTLVISDATYLQYGEDYDAFARLFSTQSECQQQTDRHPLPLLEKITLLNMDEKLLLAMADKGDGNFSPCPSLQQIHFFFNDRNEPIQCGDVGAALVSVIKSYAEYPHSATIRNNIRSIKFLVSDVNDPYDIVGLQDAAAVVIGCAKYVPHCLRELSVGTDSRFTADEPFFGAELISSFGKFEVLNTLELFCDHSYPEDDEPNNLWSDDGDDTKLDLPPTLTTLHIQQPVVDAKCLADALQHCELRYLGNFRYRQSFFDSQHNNLMPSIFTPICKTLRSLQIQLCFAETCQGHFGFPFSRYCDFNKDFCDPKKPNSYILNTLEDLSLECCYCNRSGQDPTATIEEILEKRQQSAAFLNGDGGNFFPLLNSSSALKRLALFMSSDGSIIRRLLIGDNEEKQPPTSCNLEYLHLHQFSAKRQQVQKLIAELSEIGLRYPQTVKSWKRLVLYRGDPTGAKPEDFGEEMMDLLDVISELFPSIEVLEFCGFVKSIFECSITSTTRKTTTATESVSDEVTIDTKQDLEEVLKEKNNVGSRLKYLNLGVYS